MVTEASEIGAPLWIGEFVGNSNFDRMSLATQDAFLLGSAAWGYFPSGNELVDADGTEHLELVNILARPYPLQTAGIPQSLSWNVDTHEFHYSWAEDAQRDIPDPTIIVVPTARQFPQGFQLIATPGDTVKIDGDRIIIRADRRNAIHSIEIHSR